MVLALAVFAVREASADTITVGVFAPSAPFPSTASRVELASRLGEHVGKALGGTGTGKVFARAGDFQAAVKSGEIKVALVDATFLASQSGYTVIASAVRGDDDGGLKGYARRGYTVAVPQRGESKPFRHMYVLAGFDILPDRYLLVTIRDPEFYWPGYAIEEGVKDPLELVWYDRDWNELYALKLDFKAEDFPDGFRITPDQKHLLAIRHRLSHGSLLNRGSPRRRP